MVNLSIEFARRSITPLLIGLPLWFAAVSMEDVAAETTDRRPKTLADNRQRAESERDDTVKMDANRETAVLELVRAHLPELTDVLKQLRKDQPREYRSAIDDLFKSARRLELAQKRDPRLFDLEVELLQAEHHASLLTAKLKVRDREADRKKLRLAAKRLQEAQLARSAYDVEMLRKRLARTQGQLDAAINRLESRQENAEQQLERSYQVMLRKAGRETNTKDRSADRSESSAAKSNRPTRTGKPTSDRRTEKPRSSRDPSSREAGSPK